MTCAGEAGVCDKLEESDFGEFVGEISLDERSEQGYCKCSENYYGNGCTMDIQQFKAFSECDNGGIFDPGNTITGCSCREENGDASLFHGWYCERSNRFVLYHFWI